MLLKKLIDPLTTGLMGMTLVIVGTLVPELELRSFFFLIATFPFLITAYWIKHPIFISLEWVILVGTLQPYLPLPYELKLSLPIIAGIIFLIGLIKRGHVKIINDWFGSIHLIVLATGFAVINPYVYLVGGFLGIIFAVLENRKGVPTSSVWIATNSIFCVTVLYGILAA